MAIKIVRELHVSLVTGSHDNDLLILKTCDYVTLHDKRDLAALVKVKDLEMQRLSWADQM